jgi:hypothetical protein
MELSEQHHRSNAEDPAMRLDQQHSVAPPTDQIGFCAMAAWCGFQPRAANY